MRDVGLLKDYTMKQLVLGIALLLSVSLNAQNDEESKDIRGRRACNGGSGACMDISISQAGLDAKNLENSLYLVLPQNYFTNEQENIIRDPEQAFFFRIQKNVILIDETLKTYNIDKELNVVPSGRYPVEFSEEKYRIKVTLEQQK